MRVSQGRIKEIVTAGGIGILPMSGSSGNFDLGTDPSYATWRSGDIIFAQELRICWAEERSVRVNVTVKSDAWY
jgi:hypothetical protein